MRKLFYKTFIICAVLFISCEEEYKKDPTLGQWNLSKKIVLDEQGNALAIYEEDNILCPLDFYLFKIDGNLEIIDYKPTTNFDVICSGLVTQGIWTKKEQTLTLTLKDQKKEAFTIIKNNDTEFEFEGKVPTEIASQFDNNAATLRYVFKK